MYIYSIYQRVTIEGVAADVFVEMVFFVQELTVDEVLEIISEYGHVGEIVVKKA